MKLELRIANWELKMTGIVCVQQTRTMRWILILIAGLRFVFGQSTSHNWDTCKIKLHLKCATNRHETKNHGTKSNNGDYFAFSISQVPSSAREAIIYYDLLMAGEYWNSVAHADGDDGGGGVPKVICTKRMQSKSKTRSNLTVGENLFITIAFMLRLKPLTVWKIKQRQTIQSPVDGVVDFAIHTVSSTAMTVAAAATLNHNRYVNCNIRFEVISMETQFY